MSGQPLDAKSRLSNRRLWWFRFVLVIGVYLICETISLIGLSLSEGGWFLTCSRRDKFIFQKKFETTGFKPSNDIVHPYLGWVRRPNVSPNDERIQKVSEFGFPDDAPPIVKREPNLIVIAVMGGSLAEEFARDGWATMKERLLSAPEFRGKILRVVRLGLSGYKQPQQLLLLNYLIALGAEFDFVVNIDGYNEIALPEIENVPSHVFSAFPRGWQTRIMDMTDINMMRLVGKVVYLRSESKRTAELFSQIPWRWSPTATALWLALHRNNLEKERLVHVELQAKSAKEEVRITLGPTESFETTESLHRHCVAIWSNCSRLMWESCRKRGTRYLHFLQPNQYVPDSKPLMTKSERLLAVTNHPGRPCVEQGYPLLQKAGQELAESGVEFFDLTALFQNESEETYRDDCCHLNQSGNDILARRIADVIMSKPVTD